MPAVRQKLHLSSCADFRGQLSRDPDCRILAIGIEPDEYDTWIPLYLEERDKILKDWKARGNKITRCLMIPMGWLVIIWNWPIVSLMWPLRFALNIGSTAMFGARVLELDASDRLDSFPLKPNLRLLDFDVGREFLKAELSRLEGKARGHIENRLWLRRQAFQDVCLDIEDDLRELLGGRRCEQGHVRMIWAERDGSARAVRIKHTYGFRRKERPDDEEHLDDRLVFPYETSMTAWAMETGLSQFAHRDILLQMLTGRMNRYRKSVRWQELRWCWAIPVGKDGIGTPKGVLAIESDVALGAFEPGLGREGAQRSIRWQNPETGRLWDREALKGVASTVVAGLTGMPNKEEEWSKLVAENFLLLKPQPGDPS